MLFANYLLLRTFGIVTFFIVGRQAIIHGDLAESNQFPYQATLLIHERGLTCGAGIISDEHILTAAHCLVNKNNHLHDPRMLIVVGTHDLRKTDDQLQTRKVKTVFVPRFLNTSRQNVTHDIAVLKLDRSLELSKNYQLTALILPHISNARYSGEKAVIAGFGWNTWQMNISLYGQNTDGRLRYADVDVLRNIDRKSWCSRKYVSVNQLCARVKQRDPHEPRGLCHEDDGGPLVFHGTVIGIASLISNTCLESTSGTIYTRVSRYLQFINACKNYHPDRHHEDIQVYQT